MDSAKPACVNHPQKNAVSKGLCAACYQKQRRKIKRQGVSRLANGSAYGLAIQEADQWVDAFRKNIKVTPETTCQEWVGTTNNDGYGVFHYGGRTMLAHRLSKALAGGNTSAQVVMHVCDNPRCVNPKHLRDGTYQDNVADMYEKGRNKVGMAGKHLKNRASHPRARAVITPHGEFASAALASEKIGISARTISRYCCNEKNGFSFAV